jgi:hypothetical protein
VFSALHLDEAHDLSYGVILGAETFIFEIVTGFVATRTGRFGPTIAAHPFYNTIFFAIIGRGTLRVMTIECDLFGGYFVNVNDSCKTEPMNLLNRRSVIKAAALAVPALLAGFLTPASVASATPSDRPLFAARAAATIVRGRDFAQSNYCWYLPKVTTLKNVTYIVDPMSSTKASQVPTQNTDGATNPLALMRLGPNNSSGGT